MFGNLIKIIVYAISLTALTFSVCNADMGEIPESEIAIGGIQMGASPERVRSIYGEPTKAYYQKDPLSVDHKQMALIWEYGTTLKFTFYGENVCGISTTGNNGISVPAGFSVGSNLSDVINYYEQRYNPYPKSKGKIRNYANSGARYNAKWWINLRFESDSRGKVKSISIYPTP